MAPTNLDDGNTKNKIKKTRGRKKIEIKKIEKTNSRQVTFSKRRTGLFKKASELCVLTGAQIAMLVQSPGGRHLFAFGHPDADILFDRYLNSLDRNKDMITSTAAGADTQKYLPTKEFNQHYVEVSKELEAEKKRPVVMIPGRIEDGKVAWFDESIDDLNVEELQQYLGSLEELEKKVKIKADEVATINKSTTFLGSKTDVINGSNSYVPMEDTAVYGGYNYQDDGMFDLELLVD